MRNFRTWHFIQANTKADSRLRQTRSTGRITAIEFPPKQHSQSELLDLFKWRKRANLRHCQQPHGDWISIENLYARFKLVLGASNGHPRTLMPEILREVFGDW